MGSPVSGGRVRRVAVLSDVHGNAVALQAVLEELGRERVDLIVFGGDLTWGPLPAETLALVAGISTPTLFVRGNAERALLAPSDRPTERGALAARAPLECRSRARRGVRSDCERQDRGPRTSPLLSRFAAK
jgi:hypothetical protein